MAAHRYWRIINVDNGGAAVLEISEFQMLAAGVDKTSLATKTATAVSFGALADLFDGNLSNRVQWPNSGGSNFHDAGWFLKFDFSGGDQAINGIKHGQFDTTSQNLKACTLQYSDNDSTWTTVTSVSGLADPGNFTLSALINMNEPVVLTGIASTTAAGSVLARPVLNGRVATTAVGTVRAVHSRGVTGNSAAFVIGQMGPPLSGNLTTLSAGSAKAGHSKGLTGNASVTGKGNIGTGRGITKVSATTGISSIAQRHAAALTAVTGTGSRGTVTPHSTVSCALTGSVVTVAPGTPRPAKAKLLSSTVATSAVGTARKGAGLTKVTSVTAVGTVTRARGIVLSGVSAAFASGRVGGTQPKVPTITITSRPVSRVLVGS